MTSNTEKLRAVFLTALMIGSVFAAGIAFTGGAAAQAANTMDDGDLRKATHYADSGNPILELAFEGNIDTTNNTTVHFENDVEVEVDSGNVDASGSTTGRVTIDGDDFNSPDEVNSSLVGVEIGGTEYDVTVAPATLATDGENSATAYVGTNVALANGTQSEFDIETPEDGSTTRGTGDGSHVYVYNTDGLATGEYNVTNDNGTTSVLTLENLGLEVEADAGSFDTSDNVTATATANDIGRTVDAVLLDANGDETDYAIEGETITSEGDLTLDFGPVDTADVGNYTVQVTDVDSGVTAESDEFEVVEAADTDTEFVNIEPAARGDVATINVSMTETTEANVTIGEYEDSNYQANLTLVDGDEDGYVEFNVNTYTMGNNTDADIESAFYATGDEDSVSSVELQDGSWLSQPIADGTYRTSVRSAGAENADDVSRLSITEAAGFTGQNIWTAPRSDELGDFPNDATLTQDSSITQGDWVVHEIEGEGVFGILANASNNGEYSDTQALLNAANNSELSLTVEQTEASVGPNADPKVLNYTEALQNENAGVVADAENGTIYLAAALENVNTEAGDRSKSFGDDAYNATVTLNSTTTELASADSTTSAEFSTEELSESLTQDVYNVTNADNQTLTAESNAADGSEYNLLVESTETEGDGFIMPENSATVEDGELTFEVDFTEATVGDEFSVTLEGLEEDDSATGNVVEDAGGEDETTTTTEDDETTTTEDETTTTTEDETTTTEEPDETTTTEAPADDGGDDGGESGGSIPGFGVGIALVAILGAALLALRE